MFRFNDYNQSKDQKYENNGDAKIQNSNLTGVHDEDQSTVIPQNRMENFYQNQGMMMAQGTMKNAMDLKSPLIFSHRKQNSFYSSNNHLNINQQTPLTRKMKQGSIISNQAIKNMLIAHQNNQQIAQNGTSKLNSNHKIPSMEHHPQPFLGGKNSFLFQSDIFNQQQNQQAKNANSEYDLYGNGFMSSRHSKLNAQNADHHNDFSSTYNMSQDPGALYESPAYENNQFDQSRHESYMINRASALQNNREQVSRNVSELKKIKKKKKTIRQDSVKTRKSSIFQLQRAKKLKTNGVSRIASFMRTSTFKKTFETSSNGSDNTEQDEDDPMQMVEKNFQKSKFVIFPNSTFKFLWDIFILICIFLIAIFVPFNLSFGLRSFPTSVLFLFEVVMIMDIFVNLNSGYYTRGKLIMKREEIIKRYFKSWFIIDFLSAIPVFGVYSKLMGQAVTLSITQQLDLQFYDKIASDQGYNNIYQLEVYSFFVFQFLKVLKVIKIKYLQARIYEFIFNDIGDIFFKAIKLSIYIFMIAHWLACIFWMIGDALNHFEQQTWIRPYIDLSSEEQYITSVYWAITTMVTVGYGDIHPENTYERLVTIINMVVASGMYAYIINEVSTMVRLYNTLANRYEEKMKYVNKFMRQKGIPDELRTKIIRYLEYNWELKKELKIEEEGVYGLLNDNLRDKITLYLNGRILRNIQIFENFQMEFISRLTFVFKKRSFAVDEIIFNEESFGQDMYFISAGKVYIMHKKTLTFVKELHKDDYFGEIGFFSDLPRQATLKARDYTDTMILSKDMFLKVATDDIQALKLYYAISCSVDEQNKNFKLFSLKCYLCGKMNHIFNQCPKFQQKMKGNLIPFIVKHEMQKFKESHNQSIFYRFSHKSNSQRNQARKVNKIKKDNFDQTNQKLLQDSTKVFENIVIETDLKPQQNIKKSSIKDENIEFSTDFDQNDEEKMRQHIQMQLLRRNQEYNKVPHNSIMETNQEQISESHSNATNDFNLVQEDSSMFKLGQNNRLLNNSIKIEQLSRQQTSQLMSQNTFLNNLSIDEHVNRRQSQQLKQNQRFTQRGSIYNNLNQITNNQIIEELSSKSSSLNSLKPKNIVKKTRQVSNKISNKFSSMKVEQINAKDLLRMSGEIILKEEIKKNDVHQTPFKQILFREQKPSKIEVISEFNKTSLVTEQFELDSFEKHIDDLIIKHNTLEQLLKQQQQNSSNDKEQQAILVTSSRESKISIEQSNSLIPQNNPQEQNQQDNISLIKTPDIRQSFKHRPQTELRQNEEQKQYTQKINKGYTKLIREKTQTTDRNLRMENHFKNIQNIRKRPKAQRILHKDIFSNKFFVEDFLEDINSVSILESDNLNNLDTPLSNAKKFFQQKSINISHQQPLIFNKTLTNKGNINVNPSNFFSQNRQSFKRSNEKQTNYSKILSGIDSSPLNSSFDKNKMIEDEKETDSDEQLIQKELNR